MTIPRRARPSHPFPRIPAVRRAVWFVQAAAALVFLSAAAAAEPDFEAPDYFPTGDHPQFVEQADFNGDGYADLVVSNRLDETLRILLGNGTEGTPDGSFTSLLALAATGQPYLSTVTDLNEDGIADLVVGIRYEDGVDIFLGGGSGGVWDSTFSGPSHFFSGHGAYSPAAGDFNDDGILDLAVANDCIASDIGDSLSVLIGTGSGGDWDGGFEAPAGYLTDHTPQMVLVHDWNEDGILDLATANAHGASVSVLIGNGAGGSGDGTFQERVDYTVGSGPHALLTEDFDGDGIDDLAVSCWDVDQVAILRGNGSAGTGDGTFAPADYYLVGDAPRRVVAADCDGDSLVDLVTCEHYGRTITVLPGNGDGTFGAPVTSSAGGACWSITAGDFDGDRLTDVVTVSPYEEGGAFHAGKGNGAFRSAEYLVVPDRSRSVAAADWNGDGIDDIAAAGRNAAREGEIRVFLSGGGGFGFAPSCTLATGPEPLDLLTEDFDGDSLADLLSLNRGDGTLAFLSGDGAGGFGEASFTSVGAEPAAFVSGDFDEDGDRDLLVTRRLAGTMSVLLGDGAGGFAAPASYPAGYGARGIATGDFDDDGITDAAVALLYDDAVAVFPGGGSAGTGDGTFGAATLYPIGDAPHDVIAGDWNGDGITDLAATETGADSVRILFGNGAEGVGDGTFTVGSGWAAGDGPLEILTGDWNGDGVSDLAVADSLSGTLSLLTGNGAPGAGDGTFGGPYRFAAEDWVSDLASGDFDGTEGPDLAMAGVGFFPKAPDCRVHILRNRRILTTLPGGAAPPSPAALTLRIAPNPFNPAARIHFDLTRRGPVRAAVYDVAGRRRALLFDGFLDGGTHEIGWNGRDGSGREVPSGVYLIRIETEEGAGAAKAVLLR